MLPLVLSQRVFVKSVTSKSPTSALSLSKFLKPLLFLLHSLYGISVITQSTPPLESFPFLPGNPHCIFCLTPSFYVFLFLKKERNFIQLSFFHYFSVSLRAISGKFCIGTLYILQPSVPAFDLRTPRHHPRFRRQPWLPGVLLPCVMLRIRSEGRNLVEVSGTAFSLTHRCLLPRLCLGMAFQLHSLQRVSLSPSPPSPLPCNRSNQEPSPE